MIKSSCQSTSVLLNKDQTLNRSIWWKIYFWAVTLLSVCSLYFLYFEKGSGIPEIVSLILYVPAALGLFGFVFSKKILNNKFWLYFFVIYFAWDIAYYFLNEVDILMQMPRDEYLKSYVIGWVFTLPQYLGLFLYSRSSYPLWNKEFKTWDNNIKQLQPGSPNDSCDEDVEEYKKILKKVGAALLLVGLLSMGEMIYIIEDNISYLFNFNIVVVIAGILLLKCEIKTARVIAWFAAFICAGIISMVCVLFLIQPFRIIVTQIKLNPESLPI